MDDVQLSPPVGQRPGSAASTSSKGSLKRRPGSGLESSRPGSAILNAGDNDELGLQFPTTKPLPPIGTGGGDFHGEKENTGTEDPKPDSDTDSASDEETMKLNKLDDDDDDDDDDDGSSTASEVSSATLDRPGQGGAHPKIVRGFRREMDSAEIPTEGRLSAGKRSVSFTSRSERDKLKSPAVRETSKKKTYDGREVMFVTLDTQTDWDWVAEEVGSSKTKAPDNVPKTEDEGDSVPKPLSKVGARGESREALSRGKTETTAATPFDDKTTADATPFSAAYSDEYGIPILELSSDTDDSSDDETRSQKSKDDRSFIPSIGPPQILQYIRESDKTDLDVEDPDARVEDEETRDYPVDEHGRPLGMFGGLCEFCEKDIKPFPSMEQQQSMSPEELYCCQEYRQFVEFAMTTAMEMEQETNSAQKLINIKPHAHHGTKQARRAAREKAVQRMRDREMQRKQQEASGLQQQANYFAFQARQMKTINYQLSSQKCLEEGWTLRAPSPLFPEDDLQDVFVPEPLNPAMIASGTVLDRPLIEKFYEDGQKFLTIFPDGTGNVFYPSGNLAIMISSISLGQYTYIIQDDHPLSRVLAVFEPNGYGCCYYGNTNVRLYMDQLGGIELDVNGGKKKKWSWKDQEVHVHAPPFQPICFCLGNSRFLGVRIMTQESMSVTFSAKSRSCRFNVGSRLKLVAPDNLPAKEVDDNQLFIDEKKAHVECLLDKVTNLLRFPHAPKVDRMLPPLYITSKIQKTEKLKKERAEKLAAQATSEKGKKGLPVVAVN